MRWGLTVIIIFVVFLLIITPANGYLSFRQSYNEKTVVFYTDFMPFSYVDSNGNLKGFNVDLMKAMMHDPALSSYSITFKTMSFHAAMQALKNGVVDAVFGAVKTPEREIYFNFTQPYFNISFAIFTRKGTGIKNMNDLANRTVVVRRGSIAKDYLLNHTHNTIIFSVDTVEEGLELVNRGDAAAFFGDKYVGLYYLKYECDLENVMMVSEYSDIAQGCIAVKKGDTAFLDALNIALENTMLNGTYSEIYAKWFVLYGGKSSDFFEVIEPYLLPGGVALLIIVVIVLTYFYTLKREIHRIEKKLRESERLYRSLTESALVGIMVIKKGKVLFANKRALEILGVSSKDKIEKRGIAEYLEELGKGEVAIKTPKGDRWLIVMSSKFNGSTLVNFFDITDKKKLEIENEKRVRYLNEIFDALRNPAHVLLMASLRLGNGKIEEIIKKNAEIISNILHGHLKNKKQQK